MYTVLLEDWNGITTNLIGIGEVDVNLMMTLVAFNYLAKDDPFLMNKRERMRLVSSKISMHHVHSTNYIPRQNVIEEKA